MDVGSSLVDGLQDWLSQLLRWLGYLLEALPECSSKILSEADNLVVLEDVGNL